MKKLYKLEEYNRKGNCDEHVKLINDLLKYYGVGDASKCNL